MDRSIDSNTDFMNFSEFYECFFFLKNVPIALKKSSDIQNFMSAYE